MGAIHMQPSQGVRAYQPPEPESVPSGNLTVRQVIDLYLRHAPPSRSVEAARERQRVLDLFCARFGETGVESLKPYDLLFWIDDHKDWRSNWTKNRVRSIVRRPFNYCAKVGLLAKSPFVGVNYPAGQTGRDMTDAEFRALLRASKAPFRRVLVFLRFTGARPIELRRLVWDQINFEGRSALQREHKTAHSSGKPRRIPLTQSILKLLTWIKRRQLPGTQHVFLNSFGRPWTKNALCHQLDRVRRKCGLPKDLKLYSARHAFGTGGIINGVDLATLATLMGHSTVQTTQLYIHLADKSEHLWEAAERASGRKRC
jgi:integrase